MDALDNIDLDDMFADDGDALFDGLDIDDLDIDNMMGSSGGMDNSSRSKSSLSGPPSRAIGMPPSMEEEQFGDDSSRARRTTKRKAPPRLAKAGQ